MTAMTNHQETMAVDLRTLLDAGDDAMVLLVAGETRLAAHKAVLVAGSPVYAAMLSHRMKEASTGEVIIPDVEGPVLRQLLAFLYTGRAPELPSMALQLLAAADKYCVTALVEACGQEVAAHLDLENVAAAAMLALRHSCHILRQATLNFVNDHTYEVMGSQGWAEVVCNHPEDAAEFTRMLEERASETSALAAADSSPAPASATAYAPGPYRWTSGPVVLLNVDLHTCPLNEAVVSRLRRLSDKEKARKLIKAAQKGSVLKMRALLAAGADVRARHSGWFRWTALHWAADKGHVEAVHCLLQAGAEVDARSRRQATPLHWSAWRGYADVVLLLLAASADPNARDGDEWTPLHRAVWSGQEEVAALLLQAGADTEARNNWGKTPLALAYENRLRPLMCTLQ